MLFAMAITNLNRVFKSSGKIEIGQTKTEFISVHKEENETEAVIKITDSEGAGNARIKIWGTKPDRKKHKSTVQVSRMEGHGAKHLNKLATKILQPLIEHLRPAGRPEGEEAGSG